MPELRLGVTLQQRASLVWGQSDEEQLARRVCRTGLAPLLRVITDTAAAGLCHPDLHVGNICEHKRRLMILDWADSLPQLTSVVFAEEGHNDIAPMTEEWRILIMLGSLMKQFRWIEQRYPSLVPRVHADITTVYTRRRREFFRRLRCVTLPQKSDYEEVFNSTAGLRAHVR